MDRGKDDAVLVERVNPGTPAEEAGIQAGDTVISINGMSPQELPLDALEKIFFDKAGREVVIVYARMGQEHRTKFHLAELLPPRGHMYPLARTNLN